jgi:hypothetical protein
VLEPDHFSYGASGADTSLIIRDAHKALANCAEKKLFCVLGALVIRRALWAGAEFVILLDSFHQIILGLFSGTCPVSPQSTRPKEQLFLLSLPYRALHFRPPAHMTPR